MLPFSNISMIMRNGFRRIYFDKQLVLTVVFALPPRTFVRPPEPDRRAVFR